jgi:hypothetical protein
MFRAARARCNIAKCKDAFRQIFRDVHTGQFHYMKLQTARQARNENPQEFADRCRALAQKITCKVDDPLAQRVHNKNVERMLLASFVVGFGGEPGRQTRFANPSNLSQALRVALAVQEVERQEKSNNRFYTKFENSANPQSRYPNQRYSENARTRYSVATRTVSKNTNKASNSKTRSAQTKEALRCYKCEGLGHFARECPTRLKMEERNFRPPRGKSKGERSRHSQPPSDKHAFSTRREAGRQERIRETTSRRERRQLFPP